MNSWKRREWMMKTLAALGAVGLGRLALRGSEASKTFSADFGPDWDIAKAYTIEVADAMPAEKYDFKPTPEMRPFGELMVHTAWGIFGFGASLRGEQRPESGKQPAQPTKENVVAYLKAAFDYAAESIAGLDDSRLKETVSLFRGQLTLTREKLCHLMRDHTTHHRAYSLPYLRLCGVQPPAYRFTGPRPSPM